tara:strand:+ start:4023 stop:4487 length:465 start_codon:yes stop_codon:yes gene_type:complete
MTIIEIGKKAPDFKLPATNDLEIKLSDYKGKNIVLFFYPKDNTPGCTQENKDFNEYLSEFEKNNTVVLGISRDRLITHKNFQKKHALSFELLADEDETVCNLYGVMKEKNMFGKKVHGIERSTFIIDSKGTITHIWRKVKVPAHVLEVLDIIKK